MASNAAPESAPRSGPVKGAVGYLQIPARDVTRSAEFYEHVFSWNVEAPNPSFEAPNLIGQWVIDRGSGGKRDRHRPAKSRMTGGSHGGT